MTEQEGSGDLTIADLVRSGDRDVAELVYLCVRWASDSVAVTLAIDAREPHDDREYWDDPAEDGEEEIGGEDGDTQVNSAIATLYATSAGLTTAARRLAAEGRMPIGFDPAPFHNAYVAAVACAHGAASAEAFARFQAWSNLAGAEAERIIGAIQDRPIEHGPEPAPRRGRPPDREARAAVIEAHQSLAAGPSSPTPEAMRAWIKRVKGLDLTAGQVKGIRDRARAAGEIG